MISKIDHLVLTVRSIENMLDFFANILGMEKQVFGEGRVTLKFGAQKINLHQFREELNQRLIPQHPARRIFVLLPTYLSNTHTTKLQRKL